MKKKTPTRVASATPLETLEQVFALLDTESEPGELAAQMVRAIAAPGRLEARGCGGSWMASQLCGTKAERCPRRTRLIWRKFCGVKPRRPQTGRATLGSWAAEILQSACLKHARKGR